VQGIDEAVRVPVGTAYLAGDMELPEDAAGLVVFAHGSGSSRHSPRNRFVAEALRWRGLGTLLFDLLTAEEEEEDLRTGRLRFDVGLLADRLAEVTDWVRADARLRDVPIGYFGASTGAAAALIAAAERPAAVRAVVSRGGRPDLAGPALAHVRAPTLLIVGGRDAPVTDWNAAAFARLSGEKDMQTIAGATHLFPEPGAIERVAALAAAWFERHLPHPVAAHTRRQAG
jgi:putative phosphoribosyl transferase